MSASENAGPTDAEMRAWIDQADYEALLRRWRLAPTGSPFFAGEVGQYYEARLAAKRREVGAAEHVRASKSIGWLAAGEH